MIKNRCYVQLGANGDVMNTLPLAWEASRIGSRPYFLIGRPFAGLLDGCSYVLPDIWEGQWDDLQGAMSYAIQKYEEVLCTQVYSSNYQHDHKLDSFCKDSWAQIGRLDWGSLPLVFDLRNPSRESDLASRCLGAKPAILVNTKGSSSPFPHSNELWKALHAEFHSAYDLIALEDVRAQRLYDLLGLYQRAACLVSIDTATLHLAHASTLPVVALVSDSPTTWQATPRYPGQVFRMRYSEFPEKKTLLLDGIREALTVEHDRKLVHVYSEYTRNSDAARRHITAKWTWLREYRLGRWVPYPITSHELKRSSAEIGDPRPVPLVNELVSCATKGAARLRDFIVLSNDDISFAPGFTDTLNSLRGECYWAHRRDFKSINREVSTIGLAAGHKYVGSDVFVFTPRWWFAQQFPDMWLARNQWDLVVKSAMRLSDGAEIPNCCAHEQHASFWSSENNENENPANIHNRAVADKWFHTRGVFPE